MKYLKHLKISSVDPLCHIFSKVNEYFEEIDKNKYLALVPAIDSKEKNKKHEELWSKIRNLIRSVTKNSDDYDQKHIEINFDSD